MKDSAVPEPISDGRRRPRGGGADNASSSLNKILNGTLRVIAQRGVRKLSMNDISEAAGVSRGTLYRYFPTKEDALKALAEHVSLQFERGVVACARACTAPEQVLDAVLNYHFAVTIDQHGARFMEIEPQFLLNFFRTHLVRHVAALSLALEPYYDWVEQEGGFSLDRDLCSEVLIRFQLSTILVPGSEAWSRMPTLVFDLMSTLGRRTSGSAPLAAPDRVGYRSRTPADA